MIFDLEPLTITIIAMAGASISLVIAMYKRIRYADEEAENCSLQENQKLLRESLWESALESRRLTEKWKASHGSNEVMVTFADSIKNAYENKLVTKPYARDNFIGLGPDESVVVVPRFEPIRCSYCGTNNKENHGTCCKCGAPL